MVAAYTATAGSAGYVAIENFIGSVGGKTGSFVLQHHGLMTRGEAELTVTVVPDSGTGELRGISGQLDRQRPRTALLRARVRTSMSVRNLVMPRGINVGTRNRVPMAEHRSKLADEGYSDVATVLQSGNVIVSAASGSDEVAGSA